jgi:hypothetical protein
MRSLECGSGNAEFGKGKWEGRMGRGEVEKMGR